MVAQFSFSVVESFKDTVPRRYDWPSWAAFAAKLQEPEVRVGKDGLAWIPALFKRDGKRCDADVEALTGFVLDIDKGNLSKAHIAKKLNGTAFAAHTTYSSTDEDRRWRVAIPLSSHVPPAKAHGIFAHFQAIFDNQLDYSGKNPSHLFYLPAVPPERRKLFQSIVKRGARFDATQIPDAPTPDDTPDNLAPSATVPQRFYDLLKRDAALDLRWRGHTTNLSDPSRSGLDMSLVGLLVHRDFSDADIAAILFAFPHGKAGEGGSKYIARMLRKSRRTPPPAAQEYDVVYQLLADVEMKPIRWVWNKRIARGKLTLIVGDPDLGKSQVTISFAAAITGDKKFADGTDSLAKGRVIFLSAEDDAADTIAPRCVAAGVDVTKVAVLQAVKVDGEEVPFNLARDLPKLRALIEKLGDVVAVVIDPISAYLGNIDTHRNSEVRALLMPLGKLAAELDVAIIAVSHLNKNAGEGKALMRITGSLAFGAAARAAFVVVADEQVPGRMLFLKMKNNLAPTVSGYAYRLETKPVRIGTEYVVTPFVGWEKDGVTITADEAMAKKKREPAQLDAAQEFLRTLLKDGPVKVTNVEDAARGHGLAMATVRRAKDELKIKAEKEQHVKDGQWMWTLPKVKY